MNNNKIDVKLSICSKCLYHQKCDLISWNKSIQPNVTYCQYFIKSETYEERKN